MVTPVSNTTHAQPIAKSKAPAQEPATRKSQPAITDTVQLSSTAQAHAHKLAAKESAKKSHGK
jgi:hypothetical protein